MNHVRSGDSVLIIWHSGDRITLSCLLNDIRKANQGGPLFLDQPAKLTESSRPHSTFDVVISNWTSPHNVVHTDNLFSIIIKLLKPSGKLILRDRADLHSLLKINGFVNVMEEKDDIYYAEKPNFEVGSKLSLKENGKAVWKLDTVEAAWTGADEETIDDDQLLDEDDLKKPDKDTLKVCATTGQRKACADCSCGLAEELRGETKETPKSSCGSCYLGDAFRCASCPYLGMPAFKPGEKVLLDLKSDI